MASDITLLAARLATLEKQVTALSTTPQLANSSIEAGALAVNDLDGVTRAYVGLQADGTYTTTSINGPVPPTPTAPDVTSGPLHLTGTWGGNFVDSSGVLDASIPVPEDWARLEVHAAAAAETLPEIGPESSTRKATIETPGGASVVLGLPVGDYWLRFVAVTQSGQFAVSAAAPGSVTSVVDPASLEQMQADLDAATGRLDATAAAIGDDAGNVTATSVAAKTGEFINADISKLVVTDGATISDLVAQTIAAKTGTFIKVAADALQSGTIAASVDITIGDPSSAYSKITNGAFETFDAAGAPIFSTDGGAVSVTGTIRTLTSPEGNSVFVHEVADAEALNGLGGAAIDFETGYANEIRPGRILNVQDGRPVLTVSASEMLAPGGVAQSDYVDDPSTPAYLSLVAGTAYDTRDTSAIVQADTILLKAGSKANGALSLNVDMGAGSVDQVQLIDGLTQNGFYISDGSVRVTGGLTVAGDLTVSGGKIGTGAGFRIVGATGQPTFQNGWKNNTTTDAQVGFYLDALGFVQLQGVVSSGAMGTTVFVLPAGRRPSGTLNFSTAANGGATAQVRILVDGSVNVVFGPAGGWYSLSGIRFLAVN